MNGINEQVYSYRNYNRKVGRHDQQISNYMTLY